MREKVGDLRNVGKKPAKCGVIYSSLWKLNMVWYTTSLKQEGTYRNF